MANQRWVPVVLLVSLAINLLLAGVVLGRWTFADAARPPPMAWATREMDPEAQAQLRPLLRRTLARTQALRDQLRGVTRDIEQLISAEPMDQQAMERALTRLRRVSSAYQEAMHDAILQALPQLSIEQREQLLARLLRSERPPRPPHHKPPPKEPPSPRED